MKTKDVRVDPSINPQQKETPKPVKKRTAFTLSSIEKILGKLDENIEYDIMQLKPSERINLWRDLQEYMRPKLARTELIGKDDDKLEPITIIHVNAASSEL